jgi:hypothetical protein
VTETFNLYSAVFSKTTEFKITFAIRGGTIGYPHRAPAGMPDPFGPEIKASDEFSGPIFKSYFEKLGLRNLMQKTDYHGLAALVPRERIEPEMGAKPDRIVAVSARARPALRSRMRGGERGFEAWVRARR